MRFASLGSGSQGNALVVESGTTRVLLDCGFGLAETSNRLGRLGLLPENLTAIEHFAARLEVLPFGALVLARLLKRLEPSEVHFSVFGIREGLLYSLLSEAERRKDPLLSFCIDYARLRSRSADHAMELCDWTDALFQSSGPKETDEERRLRHAACLLSDISWRAHPTRRPNTYRPSCRRSSG